MRIGELSKLTGVAVETIRFYEKQGLLPEAQRSLNNYRQYGEGHVRRLHFIKHCRSLDMGLDEIRLLTNVNATSREDAERIHAIVNAHIHRIDKQIEDLRKLRQHFGLLALCCKGNHADGTPCGLIEGLNNQTCCHHCEDLRREAQLRRVTFRKNRARS